MQTEKIRHYGIDKSKDGGNPMFTSSFFYFAIHAKSPCAHRHWEKKFWKEAGVGLGAE